MFPAKVKIVEVGPCDGLQNEKQFVPTEIKIELVERLASEAFSQKNINCSIAALRAGGEALRRTPACGCAAAFPASSGPRIRAK